MKPLMRGLLLIGLGAALGRLTDRPKEKVVHMKAGQKVEIKRPLEQQIGPGGVKVPRTETLPARVIRVYENDRTTDQTAPTENGTVWWLVVQDHTYSLEINRE